LLFSISELFQSRLASKFSKKITWTKIGGIKKADFHADLKSVENVCALKKTSDGFKISMKFFVF
jgi:hypothetical protein